jgi:hypothetical protein
MAEPVESADALARLMAAAQAGDGQSYRALLGPIAPIVRRMIRRWHTGYVIALAAIGAWVAPALLGWPGLK